MDFESNYHEIIVDMLRKYNRRAHVKWIDYKNRISQEEFYEIREYLYENGYIKGDRHKRNDFFKNDLENIQTTQKGRSYIGR